MAKQKVEAASVQIPEVMIHIPALPEEIIEVPITGVTPLIVNRFGPKVRQQIRDREAGIKTPKKARDPVAEYEEAFYRLPDGTFGFPMLGFKACTVSACRFYDKSVTMKGVKQFLYFMPDGYEVEDQVPLVRIHVEDPERDITMREDAVRVGVNATTLRYRPQFTNWSATLRIKFVSSAMNAQSLMSLIKSGGNYVGVGEWRPEKGNGGNSGINGTFTIGDYLVQSAEEVV